MAKQFNTWDVDPGMFDSSPPYKSSHVDAVSGAAVDPNSDSAGSTGMPTPYIGMMDNKTFADWRERVAKESGDEVANREFGKAGAKVWGFTYGKGTPGRLVKMRQEWVNEKKNALAGNPASAAAYLNASMTAPDEKGGRRQLTSGVKGIGKSAFTEVTDKMAELLLGMDRRRSIPEYTRLVEIAVGLCAYFGAIEVNAENGAIVATSKSDWQLRSNTGMQENGVGEAFLSAKRIVNFHYMGGPDNLGARYFMDNVERQAQDALSSYDHAKVFYNQEFDYTKGNVLGRIGKSPADLGQAGYAYNQACAQRQIDVGNLLSRAGIRLEDYGSGGEGENGLGAVLAQDAERIVNSLEQGAFNVRVLPGDIESLKRLVAEWKNYDAAVQNIAAQVGTLDDDDLAEYLDAYVHGRGEGGAPWWEPEDKLDRVQSFLRSHEQMMKARSASTPLPDGTNPDDVVNEGIAAARENGELDEYDTPKDMRPAPSVSTASHAPLSRW